MSQSTTPTGVLACLNGLIGITRRAYPCLSALTEPQLATLGKSKTQLFVDEEVNLSLAMMLGKAKPNQTALLDKLIEARDFAVVDLGYQVAIALQPLLTPRYNETLTVGNEETSSAVVVPADHRTPGILLQTRSFSGGMLQLTAVGVAALISADLDYQPIVIHVKRVGDDQPLQSYVVPVTNKPSFWTGPQADPTLRLLPDGGINLPCDGSNYYVWYDRDTLPDSVVPLQNQISCIPCGGNTSRYDPFLAVLPRGQANSLRMQIRLSCDPTYMACALAESPLNQLVIAEMLRARTIELFLAAQVATGGGTTYATVLDLRNVQDLIGGYRELFDSKLTMLKNAPLDTLTGQCFSCRTGQVGNRTGLLQ